MLKFSQKPSGVILSYTGDASSQWVYSKLKTHGSVTIGNVFTFSKNELISKRDTEDEFAPVEFKIAVKQGEYYRISKDILSLEHDVFIQEYIPLTSKTFIAEKNISVFSKIDDIADETIYIGGTNEKSIPEPVFSNLLKNFPNSYELKKYVSARVSTVISSYLTTKKEYEENYQKYMNKKISKIGEDLNIKFADSERYKYQSLSKKLTGMLEDEISYSEKQWQEEILQIILLLYPKYIQVFKEVSIRDTYNKKDRRIDLLLIDSTGNTDIIEIKKPCDKCLITESTYRDNHVPLKELSGTVMQVEKYIFYLNKWGKRGEEKLTECYKSKLPDAFKIKIINPGGIIIMGRNKDISEVKSQDFEVIKRKYKNIIDIITYDDLIGRLKFMVEQCTKHAQNDA